MTIADQIRRLKFKQSSEQKARVVRKARNDRDRMKANLASQKPTGSIMDPGFKKQLDAAAVRARENQGAKPRQDLPDVIAKLRMEGKLPPEEDATKVRYEPTPEEILGADGGPGVPDLLEPEDADPTPDADAILAGEYDPVSDVLSPEELAELERLNPPQKKTLAGDQPARKAFGKQGKRRR
jgi:hypothetical protein